MTNKPISAHLLPSTGYSSDLMYFKILHKSLFTTKYILVIPLKITFKLDIFYSFKVLEIVV